MTIIRNHRCGKVTRMMNPSRFELIRAWNDALATFDIRASVRSVRIS